MQLVWDHTFHDLLGVDPRQCKVLLTDPPLNPTRNRERMLQTMFETYGERLPVPSVGISLRDASVDKLACLRCLCR